MLKKLLLVFVVALTAFLFVACDDKETTAKGYGLVHGHYVGVVEVTVDSKGLVTDAKIEEYFLPYSFAKVAADKKENADVLEADSKGNPVYYAKYVKVDDLLFTGVVAGEVGSRTVTYSATGIANIEEWVKNEANAKKYAEAVLAEKVFIATSAGVKSTELTTVSTDASSKSMSKSESGYWPKPEAGNQLGWVDNMKEIIKDLVGTKVDGNPVKTTENNANVITVNDVKSGATVSDYIDYYNVAKRAYAAATK